MNQVPIQRLSSDGFVRFGAVAQTPTRAPTAEGEGFVYWSDVTHYHIDGETEIGYCTVHRPEVARVTWFERHDRTPEILIPVDAPFILPVMDEDEQVEAFHVDRGEAVVIGPGVWHSACVPVGQARSSYFVIFRRGTPAEDVTKRDIEPIAFREA